MKILALDSSATVATVALMEDGVLLAEYTLNNGNTHSETLLPMVETVLNMYGNNIDEIDASLGKGIFTPNFESEFRMIRKSLLALL